MLVTCSLEVAISEPLSIVITLTECIVLLLRIPTLHSLSLVQNTPFSTRFTFLLLFIFGLLFLLFGLSVELLNYLLTRLYSFAFFDRVIFNVASFFLQTLNTFYSKIENPLYTLQFEPSFQFPNYAMEGATKWDPDGWKASEEVKNIFSQTKPSDEHRASSAKVISALKEELEQARSRINELETDRRSSKKKLEQFLRKLSEERTAWRSREHEKVRAIIDDMKLMLPGKRRTGKGWRLSILSWSTS